MCNKLFFCLIIFAILPSISLGNGDFPDLLTIDHIPTKGRVQDSMSFPKFEVMENLLKRGKLCIPYLIDRLESKREVKPAVMDYWPYVEERHLALRILTDLFLDPTWKKSTIPELCYDSIIKWNEQDPALAEWDILYGFSEDDWKKLIEKWRLIWDEYNERIEWDKKGQFFIIKGKELRNCQ
jgi:hypothetical protein